MPLGFGVAAVVLPACGKDWDSYDPRLGTGESVSSAASSTASSGSGASSGGGGASSSSSSSSGGGGGAGGPVGDPESCLIAQSDTFEGSVLDALKWKKFELAGATVSQSGGQLIGRLLDPSPAGVTTYAAAYSSKRFDMSNCGVFVKVVATPDPATQAFMQLLVRLDEANYIELLKQGVDLSFKKTVNNTMFPALNIVTYASDAHAYWKIRAAAGTVYWETSPDAKTWQVQAQESFADFKLTAVEVWLAAGTFKDETMPGEAHFDDVNVLPSP